MPARRLSGSESSDATLAIKGFSLAFFIPIYFAVIGSTLDLVHGFSPVFFAFFLVVACGIKAVSVYLGARAAGETNASSWNLAIAMNARGGPGIVVASTAFVAGIIDQPFYAVLILLAIVTSLLAGSWLERIRGTDSWCVPRTSSEMASPRTRPDRGERTCSSGRGSD